jgi:Transposase DDE domain group 1
VQAAGLRNDTLTSPDFSRQVVASFDGARMTTDGGALLLRVVDRKIGLLKRVTACFTLNSDYFLSVSPYAKQSFKQFHCPSSVLWYIFDVMAFCGAHA